uniref:Uncharacterized protein n=1 Tax=Branchiostoma floridae TaxID=7739 RepID=C3YGS0_BRAFL|eukprot:XP_002604569.1 hypothetical protein BRAFLDRAFT_79449 [Branchiostoma floridae]
MTTLEAEPVDSPEVKAEEVEKELVESPVINPDSESEQVNSAAADSLTLKKSQRQKSSRLLKRNLRLKVPKLGKKKANLLLQTTLLMRLKKSLRLAVPKRKLQLPLKDQLNLSLQKLKLSQL